MPIYEYRCEACGKEEEVIQSVNAAPLTDCPACGEPALKKLVSAAAFHLKGTGWYVTDFRDNDKKKQDAKEDAGKESKDSGDAKSDSKADKESKGKGDAKQEKKADTSSKSKGSNSAANA